MSFSFPRNNNIPVKKRVEFASNPRVSSNVQALKNLNNVNLETLTINNTTIQVSGEKLNTLTTTAGTASASKALIVDNNKNISDISDIVCNELYVNGEQITGEYATGNSSNSNSTLVQNTILGEAKESKILTLNSNKNVYNINSTSIDNLSIETNIIKNQNFYKKSTMDLYNIRTITNTNNPSLTDMAYAPNLNLYVYCTSTGYIFSSSDLITWTQRFYNPTGCYLGIEYSPQLGMFIAVDRNDTNTSNNNIMIRSSDGINWTYISINTILQYSNTNVFLSFYKIRWSPHFNQFFAISYRFTNISGTFRTIISYATSSNGIDWTLAFSNNAENFSTSSLSFDTKDRMIWNQELLCFVYFSTLFSITFHLPSSMNIFPNPSSGSASRGCIWVPELKLYLGFITDTGKSYYQRIGFSKSVPYNLTPIAYTSTFNISIDSFMYWDSIIKKLVLVIFNSSSNRYNYYTTSDFQKWKSIISLSNIAILPLNNLIYNNKLLLINNIDPNNILYTYDIYSSNNINFHQVVPIHRVSSIVQQFSIPPWNNGTFVNIRTFLWNPVSKLLLTNSNIYLEGNNWKINNSSITSAAGQISYSNTLNMYIFGLITTSGASNSLVSAVRYSYNGTTWFNTNIPTLGTGSTGNGIWSWSYWSKELNMFFIGNTDTGVTYKILYSRDGITWATGYIGTNQSVRYFYWSDFYNGLICFTNVNIVISYNGITWSVLAGYPSGANFLNLTYSEELDLFVGNTSTTNVLYGSLYNVIFSNTLSTYTTSSVINVSFIKDLNIIMLMRTANSVIYTNNGTNWITANIPSVFTFNTIQYPLSVYYVSELETLYFGLYDFNCPIAECYYPIKNINLSYMNNNSITKYKNDPVITWYIEIPSNNNNLTCSVYAGDLSLFVIISNTGIGNRVMTSPDGINWTNRTTPVDNNWTSICWSSELNLFVAVANSGTGNRVMTSPDGITWTSRSSASNNNWTSICWSAELNLFVAVANSGSGNRVMTSLDGITWTSRSSSSDSNWSSICWSPYLNLFVAVATTGSNLIMTSPDGIIWTNRSSPNNNQLTSICWANSLGLLVAVASSGTGNRIITSEDGINWNSQISPADNNWMSITFSDDLDLLVAVSSNGTNNIMKSNNGIDWIIMSSNTSSWNSICWASDLGVFLASSPNSIQISNVCIIGTQNSIILNKSDLITTNASSNIKNLRLGNNSGTALVNITSNSNNESLRFNINNSNSNYVDFDYNHPDLNITTNGTNKIVNIVNSNNSTTGLAFNSILLNTTSLSKLSTTPGIASANKLAIVDSSRNISNINNISASTILINNVPIFNESDNNNSSLQDLTPGIASANKLLIANNSRNISNLNQISSNKLNINNVSIDASNKIASPIYKSINVSKIKKNNIVNNNTINNSVNSWIFPTNTYNNNLTSICYSSTLKLFVAIASTGTGNRVVTSPDTITWTSRTSAADNTWTSICWSPELRLFVAIASSGTNNRVMTSTNGTSWTSRTTNVNNNWTSICWSPELRLFVAVASSGTNNRIMISSDGIYWSISTFSYNNNLTSVCWSSELGLFVAIANTGTNNRVITSNDGITWSSQTSAVDNDWSSICWSSELSLFVAISTTGIGNRIMTSPNGVNWTSRTSAADNNWTSICWSSELGIFTAVSSSGTNNRIMTSTNGINWITRTSSVDNDWTSIIWCSDYGIFVAVASTGSDNRIMRSNMVIPSRYTIINSTNSNRGLTIDQNTGFVGINNTTPTFLLHLTEDSASKPSSSSWTVSSDERLKENIQSANIEECYNNIKNLPLKYYKWKDNIYPETLDRHKLGWIAQDVESMLPDSITTINNIELNINDFKSLNSDQIIANMHGAMYKLIQIYEEQKNKISTLENNINDMYTFLNSLN